MKKQQFINALETKGEMTLNLQEPWPGRPDDDRGVAVVTVYDVEQLPRRGWGIDECEVLLNEPLDLGLSDIGGYWATVVIKVSATVLARFDCRYPDYCDDEFDGDGNLSIYEWPDAELAVAGMEKILQSAQQETVNTYLSPLLSHADQLFGTDGWAKGITKAISNSVPAKERLAVLRTVAEVAQQQLRQEASRMLTEEAPLLAEIDLGYSNEYNDEGGTFRSLNDATVTLVTGETLYFNGGDELDYGCESQLDEFGYEVMDDLGIEFNWEMKGHKEAFYLWMEWQLGVADFIQFWNALWAWIESNNGELSSCVFRDEEEVG